MLAVYGIQREQESRVLAATDRPVRRRGSAKYSVSRHMVTKPVLDFWHQKTRVPGLSYGIVFVIFGLTILIER